MQDCIAGCDCPQFSSPSLTNPTQTKTTNQTGAKAAADAAGLIAPFPSASRHATLNSAVTQVLGLQEGMNTPAAGPFVSLVAAFYTRMLEGTPAMSVLQTLLEGQGLLPLLPSLKAGEGEGEEEEKPLAVGEIERVVKEEVDKVCVACLLPLACRGMWLVPGLLRACLVDCVRACLDCEDAAPCVQLLTYL